MSIELRVKVAGQVVDETVRVVSSNVDISWELLGQNFLTIEDGSLSSVRSIKQKSFQLRVGSSIDNIGTNSFMGDLVHQTLELMYKNKKFKKRVEKKILVKFYRDLWEKEYSDDILIAKKDE